jgi:eukaryotic-like serine/threonine-protein kinase
VATSHTADLVGRVLGGRYRLTSRLGQGAFAQVYVADDVTLRRRVAIKVLNPALADERAFLRRFAAEAQAVASLRHPHILRVYDWGEDEDDPYLVMELLEGGSLRSFLDQGRRLSPAQAARIGADVASALDHAHRRGLIHRDIKPANLIFDDEGRIALADFGLARALAEATLTEPTGTVIGTARYAAPEQIHGEALDHRADVYALALVLVEATTGQVPFAVDTSLATLMRRLRQPITVTADLGPLGAVLEAAGTVAVGDRLDAGALALRLEEVAATLPAPARLVLAGPLAGGEVEIDHQPTDVPGRPGLFDIEVLETREEPRSGLGPATLAPRPPALSLALPSAPTAPPSPFSPPPPPPFSPLPPPFSPPPTDLEAAPVAPDARPEQIGHGGVPVDDGTDTGEMAAGMGEMAAGAGVTEGEDPAVATGGMPPQSDDRAAGGVDGGRSRRGRRRRWVLAALVGIVALAGGAVAGYVETRPAPTWPVPALRGDTVAAASATLDRLHLKLAVTGQSYDPTGPAGTVLSQRPDGGRLTEGRIVGVVVSKGPRPIPVPSVVNQTQSVATAAITRLGLQVGKVTQATSLTVPAGAVISATPSGGTVLPHQSIALVVSTGKPTVVIPTLSGDSVSSYSAAASALASLGLQTVEVEQYSNTVSDGEVMVTDPAPGATATVGSTVQVVVSKGPEMVAVPDVSGDSVTGAAQALSAAGLTASGVTGNPIGTVESTTPGGGALVVIGSSVQLITG